MSHDEQELLKRRNKAKPGKRLRTNCKSVHCCFESDFHEPCRVADELGLDYDNRPTASRSIDKPTTEESPYAIIH